MTDPGLAGGSNAADTLPECSPSVSAGSSSCTYSELSDFVTRGDIVAFRRHINSSLNAADDRGRSFLMLAASMGDERLTFVRLLIARGARLDSQQHQGITALMFSCMIGAKLVTLSLLSASADTTIRDFKGLRAIDYARLKGHHNLDVLLARQEALNSSASAAETRRATPVSAAETRRAAPVSAAEKRRVTPVSVASTCANCSCGSSDQTLDSAASCTEQRGGVDNAMEPSDGGSGHPSLLSLALHTPTSLPPALLEAAQGGDSRAVEEYLRTGGDCNAIDSTLGGSMLHAACSAGHAELTGLLLAHRAEVDHSDANGCTALSVACFALAQESVRVLLEAGARVNLQDAVGLTPLMMAALSGSVPITRSLLSANAARDLRDMNGETALSYALAKGRLGIVSLLKRRHGRDSGPPPLLAADAERRGLAQRPTAEDDELAARAAAALMLEESREGLDEVTAARARARRRAKKRAKKRGTSASAADSQTRDDDVQDEPEDMGVGAGGATALVMNRTSLAGGTHTAPDVPSTTTASPALTADTLPAKRGLTSAPASRMRAASTLPDASLWPASVAPCDVADEERLRHRLEALERQLREREEQALCIVCLERARSHVLLPCGHKCLCAVCAASIMATAGHTCPVCRDTIVHVHRVFE